MNDLVEVVLELFELQRILIQDPLNVLKSLIEQIIKCLHSTAKLCLLLQARRIQHRLLFFEAVRAGLGHVLDLGQVEGLDVKLTVVVVILFV